MAGIYRLPAKSEFLRVELRDVALDWVERTIVLQHPHEQCPEELAQNLVRVAEVHDVPDEALIHWLHSNAPSPSAWRSWCEEFDRKRREVEQQ